MTNLTAELLKRSWLPNIDTIFVALEETQTTKPVKELLLLLLLCRGHIAINALTTASVRGPLNTLK